MEEKDKEKILNLFFNRVWSIERIEEYLRGKYTYKEIHDVIWNKYKKSWGRNR